MTQTFRSIDRTGLWLGAAALAALALIVYIPVIHSGGFIWDDPQYLIDNYLLRTSHGLLAIWLHPQALPQYYPLVHTTFWIEYHLAALHPTLYHVDNILLHAADAILLWRVLRRLDIPAAGLAAAIFAVHPVQVESVAWITERKNVLSALFYLLALHAYLNFAGNDFRSGQRQWKPYVLSMACFIAALLSKSVACSLPAAILLLIYWRQGRLRRNDLGPVVPFFILGLAMAGVTAVLETQHVGASGPEWNFSPLDRCLIAGRALWFYAVKLLWPHPLIFIYPRWVDMHFSLRPWLILFPLSAVAVLAALWLLHRRIGRGPLVAVLFFSGTLLPALGFINLFPMRYSFVADHFQYFACIGLIVLAAAGLQRLPGCFTAMSAIPVLFILAALSWHQERLYRNQRVLLEDVAAKNPDCWMAWADLGDDYAAISENAQDPARRAEYHQKARQCYARFYDLAPKQPWAHLKWGLVLQYEGDLTGAKGQFEQALCQQPQFPYALDCMGLLLMRMNQSAEAMGYYRKAIALDPTFVEARIHYGDALESAGDKDAALGQYSAAVATRPDNPQGQEKLANLLMGYKFRPDLALPHYAAAVDAEPERADLRVDFAAALRGVGQFQLAREQCRIALQLDPDLPQARRLWQALVGK